MLILIKFLGKIILFFLNMSRIPSYFIFFPLILHVTIHLIIKQTNTWSNFDYFKFTINKHPIYQILLNYRYILNFRMITYWKFGKHCKSLVKYYLKVNCMKCKYPIKSSHHTLLLSIMIFKWTLWVCLF